MSPTSYTNPHFWEFIITHANTPADTLRLKFADKQNENFDYSFAIDQIEARRKAKTKLYDTLKINRFLFPSPLIAEQASADDVARFHASLIDENASVLDMTAGLCIDAMHFARKGAHVTALDINPLNIEVASHNISAADIQNLKPETHDSDEFVRTTNHRFDIIFADPARRSSSKGKRIYSLQDSSPDIMSLLPHLKQIGKRLMVKCSPMIDITDSIRLIPGITDIYVVSLSGECKEILIDADLTADHCSCPRLTAVDIKSDHTVIQLITVNFNESAASQIPIADETDLSTARYLYEPAAAVMKIGALAFAEIAKQYPALRKLHPNTHVFISEEPINSFPGRSLKIDAILSLRDPAVKNLKGTKINTVCRNFGMTPDQLKKRLKTTDGGMSYLYAVTTTIGHRLIITL